MHRFVICGLLLVAVAVQNVAAQDSTSLAVLTALRDSGVRLAKAGRNAEALGPLLAIRRHTTATTNEARRNIRIMAIGAIPLLRAELGQVDQALADLAVADSVDVETFLALDAIDRVRGGYGQRDYWTCIRAAERAMHDRWAFEVGATLLEAGEIRGVDFVLATDGGYIQWDPRIAALVGDGRVTPTAVLARIRQLAAWVPDGALSVRARSRLGMAAWMLERVDAATGRRERIYLQEALRLVQPSKPVQGLYVPLDPSYPAQRLFARDLGLADGEYPICNSDVALSVREGKAAFYTSAAQPVRAQYNIDVPNKLHFPDGTAPLKGFFQVVGLPDQPQLRGQSGTLMFCAEGADAFDR